MNYYTILHRIIREELLMSKKIIIFPIGLVGLQAKNILENQFGEKGIYIDRELCAFNKEIIAVEDLKIENSDEYAAIICAENMYLVNELSEELLYKVPSIKIRTNLEFASLYIENNGNEYKRIKKECLVKKVANKNLIRVGSENDGGYIMLDDFDSIKNAYSFGIGNEMSWDEDIANRDIHVFCYDHTICEISKENNNITFEKKGISGVDKPNENLLSLKTFLKNNNDWGETNLLLKMDVEGAEWGVLESIDLETLKHFKQITFELHELDKTEKLHDYINCLSKLRRTHTPVWIHANNCGGVIRTQEIEIPALIEITFVRSDDYDLIDTHYNCPIKLDHANIDSILEIPLRAWGSLDFTEGKI